MRSSLVREARAGRDDAGTGLAGSLRTGADGGDICDLTLALGNLRGFGNLPGYCREHTRAKKSSHLTAKTFRFSKHGIAARKRRPREGSNSEGEFGERFGTSADDRKGLSGRT